MSGALNLQFDSDVLRPLIETIVAETVARLEAQRAALDDRIAFTEPEAARLLSLARHQLRDARLRGEIESCRGPGRRVLYTHSQLMSYLSRKRTG